MPGGFSESVDVPEIPVREAAPQGDAAGEIIQLSEDNNVVRRQLVAFRVSSRVAEQTIRASHKQAAQVRQTSDGRMSSNRYCDKYLYRKLLVLSRHT